MAYEQLLAEGYIKSRTLQGFFVCDITELYEFGHIEKISNIHLHLEKKSRKRQLAAMLLIFPHMQSIPCISHIMCGEIKQKCTVR